MPNYTPTQYVNSNTHIQKGPTMRTQMVTPKLCIKKTMRQRVKFVRYPTRTEKKKNPKSGGGGFYIMTVQLTQCYLWYLSQLYHCNLKDNTNRGCSTIFF